MAARICLGRRFGSAEYGLYISKAGSDVLTCPDEDLNFSSDRATLQIMEYGEIEFDTQADTVTVNHTDWGEILYLVYRTSKPAFSYGIVSRARTNFRLVTNAGDSRYFLYWSLIKIPGL